MKTPKMPPNAKDYGYDTIGGAKCFRVGDKGYSKEGGMPDLVLRQFAACMEAGWRRHTEILIATKPTCVTCRLFNRCSRGVVTCTYEDRIMAAAKYTKRWAEWSEKHAPTTETP